MYVYNYYYFKKEWNDSSLDLGSDDYPNSRVGGGRKYIVQYLIKINTCQLWQAEAMPNTTNNNIGW